MPKIKDLGITVVPEQFRPTEIGGGGGCGYSFCTDCTNQPYSICGTTPGTFAVGAPRGGCTDCTTQAFSICGTTGGGGGGGCSDCTTQAFSICGTTGGAGAGCTDCTTQAFSICGTTGCAQSFCTDCTTRPFSICGTTRGTVACRLQSRFPTILDVTTPCGGSFIGPETIRQAGGGLRLEDIAQLRVQISEQLKALDDLEKALGPQSLEEVDVREKQLNDELVKLKSLRSELGKKK
ncbi:MAG TPA: hypothetical protein VGD79_11340 [Thermoanaerobaculia bacterium]